MKNWSLTLVAVWISMSLAWGQDDLLEELEASASQKENYATAAFKGLKIVNLESTKLVADKELNFIVSHRFGSVKNGFEDFFGLDNAVVRLQFVYGISDAINIGISRHSFQKIYDFTGKARIARQGSGFPLTVVLYGAIGANTAVEDIQPTSSFTDQLIYVAQPLISRKVNTNLSFEIAPTLFHENYVLFDSQDNTQFAIAGGARLKVSPRFALTADYGYHLNRSSDNPLKNPLSFGVDIETGGHVFQLHFTNAQGMFESSYLGQANGDWGDGDFFFGFNLSRNFDLSKNK